ncbi:MAG: hypothetical protein IPM56_04040 [Ignavibacteriales bacterium]|nr:MAG: hypothetical protein IPM56_04040 [Ignavibacteriales bacterium]
MKFDPDITINVVRTWDGLINPSLIKWSGAINIHRRDAKRILQREIWNSRKFHNDGDDFVSIYISRFWGDDKGIDYLLHLKDLKNGETRVTPMYEIEFVKHSHRDGHKNYIVFKKK